MRGTKLLFAPMMLAMAAQVTFARKQADSPAQITAKVEDKLYHAQVFKHGNVQVNVDNGVATLTGTVDSVGFKTDAEREARKVDGLTVVDNISVHADDVTPRQIADQALPPIHVIVKNGNVTLEGVVANKLDRAKAETDACLAATFFDFTDNLRLERSKTRFQRLTYNA